VFDHVTIRAADYEASVSFYDLVLRALGIGATHASRELTEWDDFSIVAADAEHPPTRHLHIAFVAPSRAHVDAFWHAGVDAGHPDDGPPGERRQYRPDYYGAFLLDPDGNSAEAVLHGNTRRGGHIDHLWIRVRDLAESEAFYRTISRHTGLRDGRRWQEGVQFLGAWSSFSLVSDGRPPSEHVHIAFAAPDRETVQEFHRAATAAGHESNGEPAERAQYNRGYYAAYVRDPDGSNIESVFHARDAP
jgi:catechol 2,3-dioxygenase-like lactoylglutathione lyase family enzyme